MKKYPLSLLTLFYCLFTFSQDYYGLNVEIDSKDALHRSFERTIDRRPPTLTFGVEREGRKLYLTTSDARFLPSILGDVNDGLAIDIVSKERYKCGNTPKKQQVRGKLLKPVYSKQLFSSYDRDKGRFRTSIGSIPSGMELGDIEFNILFFKNKKAVHYYVYYDIDTYEHDLMDTGLFYFDTIVEDNRNVPIEAQKIISLKNDSRFTSLLKKYNAALRAKNPDQALDLFKKIYSIIIPADDFESMELLNGMKTQEFGDLRLALNTMRFHFFNQRVYKYLAELEELEGIDASDERIQYNKVAKQFVILQAEEVGVDFETLKEDILNLSQYGFTQQQINKFLFNLELLRGKYAVRDRDAAQREAAVEYALNHYMEAGLNDLDYIRLAEYLSLLDNRKRGTDFIWDRIEAGTASSNQLFYYINAFIAKDDITKDPKFIKALELAKKADKNRYCRLFETANYGGVTFQLLEDPYLMKEKCAVCK